MLLQLDTDTVVNREHDFDRVRSTFASHWPEASIAEITHIGSCDNDIYLVELGETIKSCSKVSSDSATLTLVRIYLELPLDILCSRLGNDLSNTTQATRRG